MLQKDLAATAVRTASLQLGPCRSVALHNPIACIRGGACRCMDQGVYHAKHCTPQPFLRILPPPSGTNVWKHKGIMSYTSGQPTAAGAVGAVLMIACVLAAYMRTGIAARGRRWLDRGDGASSSSWAALRWRVDTWPGRLPGCRSRARAPQCPCRASPCPSPAQRACHSHWRRFTPGEGRHLCTPDAHFPLSC
jgi:hypothetical protein